MPRTNLFFKVDIEHDEQEKPEKLADQIIHQLLKFYGVRSVELSSYTTAED